MAAAEVNSAKAKLAKAGVASDVRVRLAETAPAAAEADLASARAKAAEAAQNVAEAEVEVKKAELELTRTRIVAPIDGVVMQLNVRVGSVLGGRPTGPEQQDAVVTLYDPKKLQVRVEVPVAKFQHVRHGHPAEVEVEDVLPGEADRDGAVRHAPGERRPQQRAGEGVAAGRPAGTAAPGDDRQRPVPGSAASRADPKPRPCKRMVVPRRLLVTEGEQGAVWVVDPVTGRAELRAVELAPGEKDRTGETVEVVGGLNPTDKLIATGREQLKPGLRVQVVGEDR